MAYTFNRVHLFLHNILHILRATLSHKKYAYRSGAELVLLEYLTAEHNNVIELLFQLKIQF